MSYSIGQYFHIENTGDYNKFKEIKNYQKNNITTKITVGTNSTKDFVDVGFSIDGNFQEKQNYYFNCEIVTFETSEQIFNIKLLNKADPSKQQYIKTITIPKGTSIKIPIDFIFSPIISFDTIVFELQRIESDFTTPREAQITIKEISLIKNIIPLLNTTNLIKIGIQGTPGTKMCINNEEILIGRTGIYEIKNGIVTIDFFSVVAEGEHIPTFTLDYIYEEEVI